MGRAGLAAPFVLALALGGCSPVYVLQSAAGHAGLLLHRKSISGALKDPRTQASLHAGLETAESARRFAFEAMGLAKSSDFSTYVVLDRSAVTYLVSASPRTRLEAKAWCFWPAGCYPYKGHFKKERALAEAAGLEKDGWDASVGGAAAYNTPLPLSDPLPSPALSYSTGALAALLIHEYAHGTVNTKDQQFNESMAEFVGRAGAQAYLARRFGADSKELAAYRVELAGYEAADSVFIGLYDKLSRLYSGAASDEEKVALRQPLLDEAKTALAKLGFNYAKVNNALVTAHRVYHDDLPFDKLLAESGGDWPKFVAALRALDRKDPAAALRRRYS